MSPRFLCAFAMLHLTAKNVSKQPVGAPVDARSQFPRSPLSPDWRAIIVVFDGAVPKHAPESHLCLALQAGPAKPCPTLQVCVCVPQVERRVFQPANSNATIALPLGYNQFGNLEPIS